MHSQVKTIKLDKSPQYPQAIEPKFESKQQQQKQTNESEINKLKSEDIRI